MRNVLLLLTKRLETLDQRITEVAKVARQASNKSNLANEMMFNQNNQQYLENEIRIMRQLFGSATPTLGDMIPNTVVPEDDNYLGLLVDMFADEDAHSTTDSHPIKSLPNSTEPISNQSPPVATTQPPIATTQPPVAANPPPPPLSD